METFTFTYKTKVEQFKEQFPEIYDAIYQEGYDQGFRHADAAHVYADEERYDSSYDDEYAKPTDDSKRYCLSASQGVIYAKAKDLVSEGYNAGNVSWESFLEAYKNHDYDLYIAWNPTHKIFAVESDPGFINRLYPHLVDAVDISGSDI